MPGTFSVFLQRHRILLLHLSFWCVYFSFFYYRISGFKHKEDPDEIKLFFDTLQHVTFVMLVSYLNYLIFLPRYLKKRKFGVYLLEFLPLFGVLIAAYVWLVRTQVANDVHHKDFFFSERFVVSMTLNTLFLVIFVGVLKFAEDWFELEARKKELENERLSAELRFLKAQVNPHFLFNTLNNLYYLAFTQSPNTTEVIAKLSQMMRYMIYDSNTPEVPLEKEIEYMENYISLEKLRLNNEIPITFEVSGDTARARIVPLILITFLENAFKHGVSSNNPDAWVRLKLTVVGNALTYTVENSKPPATAEIVKTGIGLQNVERRLALSYPGKYSLEVKEGEDAYFVCLNLDLRD